MQIYVLTKKEDKSAEKGAFRAESESESGNEKGKKGGGKTTDYVQAKHQSHQYPVKSEYVNSI